MITKKRINEETSVECDSAADCAFQYFAESRMIEDTGLITSQEAAALWQKHKEHFIEQCERGNTAEMAIWIEMTHDTNYHKTGRNVRSDDVTLKNGIAYTLDPVF